MKKRRLLRALGCVVGTVLLATSVQAQGILLDTRGDVEVWSFPQDSGVAGYDATKIVLQGKNEGSKLVTFENIVFDGVLAQNWLPGSFGGPPQPTTWVGQAPAWGIIPAEWQNADSHIVIEEAMVGGGAGGSFTGLNETNDESLGDLSAALPNLPGPGPPAVSGIGSIQMGDPTDAFFLDTQFQTQQVDLAYLVRPTEGAAADHVTMTIGVLGEGIINSGEEGGAFWDALPILFVPDDTPRFCDTTTAQFCFDFDKDDEGVTPAGDGQVITGGGGKDSPGYLKVTDAANGQRGKVVVPVAGTENSLVFGGRTGGANAAHHIDNLEASIADGRVEISAYLRVGGGTDSPADGFSFSFVPNDDPAADASNTDGFAGIGTEPANLPEEGTVSGISIGFDEWQSGDAPATVAEHAGPDARDVIGMSLRVDGVLVGQSAANDTFPGSFLGTLNGALDDVTSLQTGDRGPGGPGDTSELGWALLTINAPLEGANISNTTVTWKGAEVNFIPEPASGLMALMSLLGLGLLRRKNR